MSNMTQTQKVDSKSAAQVRAGATVQPAPSWFVRDHGSVWIGVRRTDLRSAKRQREAQRATVQRTWRDAYGWWFATDAGLVGPHLGQDMLALVPAGES